MILIKIKSNNFSLCQRKNFLMKIMIVNNLIYRLEIMDAALTKGKKSRLFNNYKMVKKLNL